MRWTKKGGCSPPPLPSENTRHYPNVVSMLDQRLRRWLNIETTSVERLFLAGPELSGREVHNGYV